MSTKKPPPDGHRVGEVRRRSQLETETMGEEHFTKRDTENGEFMAQKKDEAKFKGVCKEK